MILHTNYLFEASLGPRCVLSSKDVDGVPMRLKSVRIDFPSSKAKLVSYYLLSLFVVPSLHIFPNLT